VCTPIIPKAFGVAVKSVEVRAASAKGVIPVVISATVTVTGEVKSSGSSAFEVPRLIVIFVLRGYSGIGVVVGINESGGL
jgi:hypothetical protein